MRRNIGSTRAFQKCITWDGSPPPPQESPMKKICIFPGDTRHMLFLMFYCYGCRQNVTCPKRFTRYRHYTLWFKKNAPTLADYNYDTVQSILIIFSKLFVNDHKSCLMAKFSTSPHICCYDTLWNTMLYFALITLLIAKKNSPTSDHHNFNKR